MKDLLAIKQAINGLKAEETKSYLFFILREIHLLKGTEKTIEDSAASLIELYDGLLKQQESRVSWDPNAACTHVHIVIGDSFSGSMKQAIRGLDWTETHKVITLSENYAIGPLHDLDSIEGREARSEWFRDHITDAFEAYSDFEEKYAELLAKLEQIPEQAKILVWTSSNASEQMGMRHAIHLLHGKNNSIRVVDACAICEELYNRPQASIDYLYSGEIPPEKLQEALLRVDDHMKLSPEELDCFALEWQAISEQKGILRIWKNGAIVTVSEDYYDAYLLEKLDHLQSTMGGEVFLKAARVIGEAIGYSDQYIGDSYFEYRLRELIYNGTLEIKGVPGAMRFYSVRRKKNHMS